MKRSLELLITLVLILFAPAAVAQEHKYEFKTFFGYTVSPNLDIAPQTVPGNAVIERMSPRSSFSYGLQLDYFLTERLSAGFIFAPQLSQLWATATAAPGQPSTLPGVPGSLAFADMVTYNGHGVITYNLGAEKASIRPFILGGAGITRFSPSEVIILTPNYSGARNIDGINKFSPTMGGGVKTFISPRFGFQVMARYTPTHIGSGSGVWCSPYWGCFQLTGSQWSHQIEFTGGIVLRF
jgi:hypothetical protein